MTVMISSTHNQPFDSAARLEILRTLAILSRKLDPKSELQARLRAAIGIQASARLNLCGRVSTILSDIDNDNESSMTSDAQTRVQADK